jgi:CRISPR system Cascade subunit CasE
MNTEPLFLTRLLLPHGLVLQLRPPIRDGYDWHQRAWQCFEGIIPPDPNKGHFAKGTRPDGQPERPPDFLTRLERTDEGWRLFIVSGQRPGCPAWCPADCWETKQIAEAFLQHSRFWFQLLANPVVKRVKGVVTRADGARVKQHRHAPISKREDLVAWLQRKADKAGFAFEQDSLRTVPVGRRLFHKGKEGHFAHHTGVDFQGFLRVTDPAAFRRAFRNGIGPAKSFGFGLLAVVPVN